MKPLDCVGVDLAKAKVGKHDFRPSLTEPIVHGVGHVPVADELAAVTRERDSLAAALSKAAKDLRRLSEVFAEYETHRSSYTAGCMARDAEEELAKLIRGELRKPGA